MSRMIHDEDIGQNMSFSEGLLIGTRQGKAGTTDMAQKFKYITVYDAIESKTHLNFIGFIIIILENLVLISQGE